MDPVQLIREDHGQVRALFQAFDKALDHRAKERIAKQLILNLEVQATVEEEILYAQIRVLEGGGDLITAAEAEHHDADAIMLALSEMPRGDKRHDAKFASLRRIVEHHFDKEEVDILPRAYLLDPALLRDVALRMERRKHDLFAKAPYPLAGRRTKRPARPTRTEVRAARAAHQAHAG
jgi:hypothetical protein